MAGTGLLVSELNVPVIPIKLEGLFEVKRRRQFFVRPGKVVVTFGNPVQFSAGETPAQITGDLESRVANL
jgi:long-chain acyl-CoA synthetase